MVDLTHSWNRQHYWFSSFLSILVPFWDLCNIMFQLLTQVLPNLPCFPQIFTLNIPLKFLDFASVLGFMCVLWLLLYVSSLSRKFYLMVSIYFHFVKPGTTNSYHWKSPNILVLRGNKINRVLLLMDFNAINRHFETWLSRNCFRMILKIPKWCDIKKNWFWFIMDKLF